MDTFPASILFGAAQYLTAIDWCTHSNMSNSSECRFLQVVWNEAVLDVMVANLWLFFLPLYDYQGSCCLIFRS